MPRSADNLFALCLQQQQQDTLLDLLAYVAALTVDAVESKGVGRKPAADALTHTVTQIENDYDKEVYNGDLGIVARIDLEASELVATFDGRSNGLLCHRPTQAIVSVAAQADRATTFLHGLQSGRAAP